MSIIQDFQPIADAAWPQDLADMQGGFATRLNVYRVMAHHPALLRAWRDLRQHVVVDTSLGLINSEVVILRTGVHMGSDYEWGHHVSRARALGMTDGRIATLRGAIGAMTPEDGVFAQAVDELFEMRKIAPATARDVQRLVGGHGVMDVIATVGFYTTLGMILNSFDTPLDDAIAAELETRPLGS